jgi:hypothetical protein
VLGHPRHRLGDQIFDDGHQVWRELGRAEVKPLPQRSLSIRSPENRVDREVCQSTLQPLGETAAAGPRQPVKIHHIDAAAADDRVFNAWANEQDVARDHLVPADQREGLVPPGKHAWHGVAVRPDSCDIDRKHRRGERDGRARHEPPMFRTFLQRESSL